MSGQDLGSMDLEAFSRWDVKALKSFLQKRDLKVSGTKSTLVARAFAAWEQGVPVLPNSESREAERRQLYQRLLHTPDEGMLPDPFVEIDSWLNEEEGMSMWPPIMLHDISDYLQQHQTHIETASIRTRLLKDYKEQKAYSYFSSNWLFEIKLKKVSEKYRFLSAECRPSQRLNNPPHDLWVCSTDEGSVISAYCTCFAGLGQSCNHVTALLLKVDFCWRYGLVVKTCTSKPRVWNACGGRKTVEPRKLCDLGWKKPGAMKLDPKKTINPVSRKLFNPLSNTKKKGMTLDDFFSRLTVISPKSVVLAERNVRPSTDEAPLQSGTTSSEIQTLKSVSQLAAGATDVKEFMESLPSPSIGDRKNIEEKTNKQSECDAWYEQREGSVTASNFHDIYTKMSSLSKDATTDVTPLTKLVLGYSKPRENLPALKYGRRMEADGRKKYAAVLKAKGHKQLSVKCCGLFVHFKQIYIRASPDAAVHCSCCGHGLLEVKCPLTSAHTLPSPETVGCLKRGNDGKVLLNRAHKYFDQVVGQIIISEKLWCDFFVFSMHGYHLERIYLREAKVHWAELHPKLEFYFTHFLAPELVHRNINATDVVCSNSTKKRVALANMNTDL